MMRPDNLINMIKDLPEADALLDYIHSLEKRVEVLDMLSEMPACGYATVLDLLEQGIEGNEEMLEQVEEAGLTHFADAHRLDILYLRIAAGFMEHMNNELEDEEDS